MNNKKKQTEENIYFIINKLNIILYFFPLKTFEKTMNARNIQERRITIMDNVPRMLNL